MRRSVGLAGPRTVFKTLKFLKFKMRYTVFFRRYAVFFRTFLSGLLSFVLHWVRGLFESFKDYQHCERCTEINLEISKRYSAFFSAFSTRYSSFVLQWPPLFFKLPKDWQHSKQRTNIKFDVSESFSGATLCFSLLFPVNFFIRITLMSIIFSSCLMISSTVNDTPISNMRYLKVFRRYAVFSRVFSSHF